MNGNDIVSDLTLQGLDHREAQFTRAALIADIDLAIAAAVAEERDKARPIEVALRSLIEDIENFPGEFDADSESVADARQKLTAYEDARTAEQAAAIRARK